MKKLTYLIILSLLMLAGCEDFLTMGDEIIQDANSIAGGVKAVLESPAGAMIPPEVKLYGVLGIALTSGIVNAWQEWRNKTMKKTTRAIVKGIEETSSSEKAALDVKTNIADEMRKQGGDKFYARANKIVDKLKIS